MEKYSTLTEAIDNLTRRGYTYRFNMQDSFIECGDISCQLKPNDFKVDEKHNFQDEEELDKKSKVYAISSNDNQVKGLLIDEDNSFSKLSSSEIVQKLNQSM